MQENKTFRCQTFIIRKIRGYNYLSPTYGKVIGPDAKTALEFNFPDLFWSSWTDPDGVQYFRGFVNRGAEFRYYIWENAQVEYRVTLSLPEKIDYI